MAAKNPMGPLLCFQNHGNFRITDKSDKKFTKAVNIEHGENGFNVVENTYLLRCFDTIIYRDFQEIDLRDLHSAKWQN